MQKPTMRWVSLSFREVKFADIALVGVIGNVSHKSPPKTGKNLFIPNHFVDMDQLLLDYKLVRSGTYR